MNLGVSFAPLVPAYVVWAAFGAAVLISVLLLLARSRGAPVRALALALMVLALANPSLTREDRDPIPSVAAVIVDKSPSQDFGDRNAQTEAARATLVERLKRIPGLEVRVAEAGEADGENDGTRLFSALSSTLADVPPDRIAGAIMITDGRVHDVPADAAALGFAAPLHALITGHADEIDRRVVLTQTPRFGIVGQSQTIGFRIEDQGAKVGAAEVTVRRDGEVLEKRVVTVHTDIQVKVPIPHAGANIVEIEASPLDRRAHAGQQSRGDLDRRRARQAARAAGVRRAACRRAHLAQSAKSDASVDLVHFTILRPPEKQDGTPINELVADRVSDARTVPAEDLGIPAHHLRPLRPPGRAADDLFRQHREICARRRRRADRRRPRLRQPDQHLAHAARRDPAGRAERRDHRTAVPRRRSPTPASAIR